MNPEAPQNPREQLEVRLTALLLGELPDAEATALREVIAKDASLAAQHERMRQTIDLVRATAFDPASETAPQPAPLKLSESRRQKLLAEFKTVKPPQFARPPQRKWFAMRHVAAAAAVLAMVGVLSALLLPALSSTKEKAVSSRVANNLRQIEIAKEEWASEQKTTAKAEPTLNDLKPFLSGGELPKSVAGESYKIGKVGELPAAEIAPDQMGKLFAGRETSVEVDGNARQKLGSFVAEYHIPEPRQQGILLIPPPPAKVELKLADPAGQAHPQIAYVHEDGFSAKPLPQVRENIAVTSSQPAVTPPGHHPHSPNAHGHCFAFNHSRITP